MASTPVISMASPAASFMGQKRPVSGSAFFHPIRVCRRAAHSAGGPRRLEVQNSGAMKERVVTGLTAAALAAALVVPDIAEAAQPGVSPSLRSYLFSIVSGGVVLTAILGAVVGVANFDPVKRT